MQEQVYLFLNKSCKFDERINCYLVYNRQVDAANSRITSEKESATAKVDQLDSKGTELVEEVRGYLSSYGSLCDRISCFASKLHIAAIPHVRKMKIKTEIQSCSM